MTRFNVNPWLLIVGFSLIVHLPKITSPLLDYHAYRQCQTASMARNYVRHGMHFFQPELDTEGTPVRAGTEFPIYSYLLALLFKGLGVHEILGRLLSCFFAAWGAVFLYQCVRPRLGESIALCSALVMCVLPIHLYFTRSVQPEPMALWGLLGFVYYLDRWLNRAGSTWDAAFAIVLGAIASLLKLPFLYLVLPLWLYLGCEREGWKSVLRPAYLMILAGLTLPTFAWYHYAKTAPATILPLSMKEHWDNLRPILTLNLWRNHFVSRLPELCLTYSGLLFAGVGSYTLYKDKKLRFWAVWFLSTALYIVLLGQYGLIHRYTELPFAPIFAVFIGSGIGALWEKHSNNRLWKMGVVILVLGIPLHSALRIAHWYHLEYPWVFRAHEVLAQVTRPEDLIITNTREHPVLLYYLDRYGYAPALEDTTLAVIDTYRTQGIRFFLTPTAESWSRHPEWSAYFDQMGQRIHEDPDFLIYRLNGA